MVKSLFDEAALKRIESEVKAAEARTSGEIVVLVVPASDSYAWVTPLCGVAGAVIASIAMGLLSASAHWSFSFWHTVEWQAVGALAGMVLSVLPSVRRTLIPKGLMAARVDRECLANFTALGLTETRERTGILVYLSELEHRVEILGDKGIHSVVGADYWKEQVHHIVEGIHRGHATDAVCEAVRQMGENLASHFPRRADDSNELSDEVRKPNPAPKK